MTSVEKRLAGVIIAGICVLGALSIAGNVKTDSARRAANAADKNARIAQQTADRTECIRTLSNELDHAHWYLIGLEFQSFNNGTARTITPTIGAQLAELPLTQDIANHGGSILGKQFERCPAAPTKETP